MTWLEDCRQTQQLLVKELMKATFSLASDTANWKSQFRSMPSRSLQTTLPPVDCHPSCFLTFWESTTAPVSMKSFTKSLSRLRAARCKAVSLSGGLWYLSWASVSCIKSSRQTCKLPASTAAKRGIFPSCKNNRWKRIYIVMWPFASQNTYFHKAINGHFACVEIA